MVRGEPEAIGPGPGLWSDSILLPRTPYWIIDDRSAEKETAKKIPTGDFAPRGSSMITVTNMIDLPTIYQVNEDIYYYFVHTVLVCTPSMLMTAVNVQPKHCFTKYNTVST